VDPPSTRVARKLEGLDENDAEGSETGIGIGIDRLARLGGEGARDLRRMVQR
jgi:hypothetical protein